MATDVTGIVAEGLRLPNVRLFEKGVRNNAVADIISTNSRLPDFVTGDLWARVSAGRRAARLIRGLCERYGAQVVRAAIDDAHATGRARALQGLSKLPHGIFEVKGPQDDGTAWKAQITITEDRFTVDLRDAPGQASGPYNTCRDGPVVACQILFKALTDPERFANAGSLFDPSPEAAHGYYFETRIRLIDMLWRGLVEKAGVDLPAGSFASIFGVVIPGEHPVTGRRFTMVEPQVGGWGATRPRRHLQLPYRSGRSALRIRSRNEASGRGLHHSRRTFRRQGCAHTFSIVRSSSDVGWILSRGRAGLESTQCNGGRAQRPIN